ncbi:hypothetical protein Tco_0138882 [Tanacetum coccineum]
MFVPFLLNACSAIIPNQLPVEPPLAPNPLEIDNDYLDAVDYDDEEEPYEDLEDEEEDPEEDPKIDLDEEEEDLKMDLDDEEEEPLPASPPPLSLSNNHLCPLSTYEVGEPSSVAYASVFSARYKLNQLGHDFGILRSRVQSLAWAFKVARAVAVAEITRAAATAGGAGGSNNTGPAAGAEGPNVVGPTVGSEGACWVNPTGLKDQTQPIGIENAYKIPWVELKKMMIKQYCPRSDIQKLEAELWNHLGLPQPIHGNVTSFDLATIHEAMRMARRLLDQAMRAGIVQENAKGYATTAAAPTGGRGYTGNLPLCNRCKLHHTGPCTIKCTKMSKMWRHQTKDFRGKGPTTSANTQPILTCFGCGENGNFKYQCPQINGQPQTGGVLGKFNVWGDFKRNAPQKDPKGGPNGFKPRTGLSNPIDLFNALALTNTW